MCTACGCAFMGPVPSRVMWSHHGNFLTVCSMRCLAMLHYLSLHSLPYVFRSECPWGILPRVMIPGLYRPWPEWLTLLSSNLLLARDHPRHKSATLRSMTYNAQGTMTLPLSLSRCLLLAHEWLYTRKLNQCIRFNNPGTFSKVKQFVWKWIGTRKRLYSSFWLHRVGCLKRWIFLPRHISMHI